MFQTLTFLISLPAIIVCLLPSRYFKPSTYDEFMSGLDSITISMQAIESNIYDLTADLHNNGHNTLNWVKSFGKGRTNINDSIANCLIENVANLYLNNEPLVLDSVFINCLVSDCYVTLSISIDYNHKKIFEICDLNVSRYWNLYEYTFTPTYQNILDCMFTLDDGIHESIRRKEQQAKKIMSLSIRILSGNFSIKSFESSDFFSAS